MDIDNYTVSQKTFTHLNSVTLSNLDSWPIFKICALLERVQNLLENLYDTTHLNLSILLRYLGKLKIQIVSSYSADMEENSYKLHFESPLCYSSTNFDTFSV